MIPSHVVRTAARLRARSIRPDELSEPAATPRLPRVVEPRGSRAVAGLRALLVENRDEVARELRTAGALLFRGWEVYGAEDFERVLASLGYDLESRYPMGTAPRRNVGGRVFTSTEAPPDFPILAHNEMSYLATRPLVLAFHCAVAPKRFGETPLFDMRAALRDLDRGVRARLERLEVRYVRKLFHRRRFWQSGLQRTWPEVFGTESRTEVEEVARSHGGRVRWKGDDLVSETVVDPIVRHPETGEASLNVQLFHRTNVRLDIENLAARQSAITNRIVRSWAGVMFRAGLFPMEIRYGNGAAIADADVRAIRDAIWKNAVLFAWKRGDVLLLDNLATGHGRMNVEGAREIHAAFGRMIGLPPPALPCA